MGMNEGWRELWKEANEETGSYGLGPERIRELIRVFANMVKRMEKEKE